MFRYILIFACTITCFFSCSDTANAPQNYLQVNGYAQGSTYQVIYQDSLLRNFASTFDSILRDFDLQLSTYRDTSEISFFNQAKENHFSMPISAHFLRCVVESKAIYNKTSGYFNPTVFPLVKAWGFFKDTNSIMPSDKELDSILKFCDYSDSSVQIRSILFEEINFNALYKVDGRTQLDFNAIAQGLSVDILAEYLDTKNINNYMIEVGGELRTKGVNPSDEVWKISIDKPIENQGIENRQEQVLISANNKGVATSGNYRKFKVENGKKYTHTINALTGKPFASDLLSVTVLSETSAKSDGYATAFMAMGLENSKQFIIENQQLNLKVYFIYDSNGEFGIWTNIEASQLQESQIES